MCCTPAGFQARRSPEEPSNRVFLFPQDVLLLYYAQWCGFCPSLNHIFIQLARLLPADTFTVAR